MRRIKLACYVLVIALSSSCATIMLSTTQEVSVSSNPAGALVTHNGVQVGKAPALLDLKRKGNHRIKVELEGYEPYEVFLSRSTSGWIFGNIIFGGIPGLIIDAITGSMYVLKPEQIQAELRKRGIDITPNDDQMLIAVTMVADPGWSKIGELKRDY